MFANMILKPSKVKNCKGQPNEYKVFKFCACVNIHAKTLLLSAAMWRLLCFMWSVW